MFSVPALLAAIILSVALFGSAAGLLWLFVFGDNPWPTSASKILMALFVLTCAASWLALLATAYVAGRREESRATLNVRHVAMSAGATALLLLAVVMHQWNVGNLGTPGDDILCSGYCRDRGFAGSATPPRDTGEATCSCLDAQGREATKVPMAEVTAQRRN
ncbi:MAG: hypothetical protein WC474_12155 [Hydrogenophilaceae bacterium]